MGHRKKHAPKRGSLSYSPRKRARSTFARTRFWPSIEAETPTLLGFVGYKAGMTHVFAVEDRKRSPNYGKEIILPATILETPPLVVCAIRTYEQTFRGLQAMTEAWVEKPPKGLERILTIPESFESVDKIREMEENLVRTSRIRIVAATNPERAGISKKKPEVTEIEVGGGTIKQQFEYARKMLGGSISPADAFKEGQYVDVIAVTAGKGFQGPVKRWGVRILQHKGRKTKRGVATLGPWKPPRVMYSIPRAGQMGFHQRTERNKRILKIGIEGKEVTPRGGFLRYGVVRGSYLILEGSLPGPAKRAIKLRHAARPPKQLGEQILQTTFISVDSPQGK